MKCPKCGYEWIPRVKSPKRCPRCGKWLIPKPTMSKIVEVKPMEGVKLN